MLSKIDWPNHIIAFFSALLGILIAFQMEDYREGKGESEELETAMRSIQLEIENNLKIYQWNTKELSNFLAYVNLNERVDSHSHIVLAREEYDSYHNISSGNDQFKEWTIVLSFCLPLRICQIAQMMV
jgi:hypothetical protein